MTRIMKSTQHYFYYFVLAMLFSFSACVNTQKMIDEGRYDEAVNYAVKKLAGKTKKKQKYVYALERGFNKAVARDMKQITKLEKSNNPENWERIAAISRKIRLRQDKIQPLLPVIDKNGYKANFSFIKIDGIEEKAKRNAADFWYTQAQELLLDAEHGEKKYARQALRNLNRIEQYFKNYKDKETLKDRAVVLGTTRILFKMENDAPVILPLAFENEITRINVSDLNYGWNEFYLEEIDGITMDYDITMKLTHIDLSPERVKEREYIDAKEIEEGWEYILDQDGNVAKDSLGNDIKIAKRILIRAKVFELFQSKDARVAGDLEYRDRRKGRIFHREPISVDAVFENYASTYQGDYRALSPESKKCIGKNPLPFPTDEELLLMAADILKPIVKEKMEYQDLL